MGHDLVITNGTLIDGTGAPARSADVGIDGDRVSAIGPTGSLSASSGGTTIDADGLSVTPGFVDIHTHYDAQIGWDPLASSSCWHGVTSIVMGNCGMTFAPVRPGDHGYLARCMESVEDIPADTIIEGLAWDWVTYGDYLGSLRARPLGLNIGGMVGHAALRYWAMGDRSLDTDEAPSASELAEMCRLLAEGIDSGALGLSTSRTLRHHAPDGRNVPGTFASLDELDALASVLGERERGVLEAAPRFDGDGPSEGRARSEVALMAELSRRSGRPFTFNLTHTFANSEHHRLVLELVAAANSEGAHLRPQTTSRGIGVLFALSGSTPFDRHPSWLQLKDLDPDGGIAGRLAAIRDPLWRRRLEEEGATGPGPDAVRGFHLTALDGATVDFGCDPETDLAEMAAAQQRSPAAVYLDALDASDGRAIIYWPILNQSLDAVAEMLTDDNVVLGLADGGAHVGQILDASQPTWFLTHWVRDRGLCTIERAVQRLSGDGATLFGLDDRGTVEVGSFADLNLIDLDRLALGVPEVVHDFPLDAPRFVQRASGYVATIVNGVVLMRDGEHTGSLPGAVLGSPPA